MNTFRSAVIVTALAMAFFTGCGGGGGCENPDSSGRIVIGGGITYERCQEAAKSNSRCTSGGSWSRYESSSEYGECKCYAKPCEEEEEE